MANFVVETFVPQDDPDRFVADVRSLRAAAARLTKAPGGVRHLRSYLVPSDAMGFHVLEAETADDVARVTTAAHIEVERIVTTVSVGALRSGSRPRERAG